MKRHLFLILILSGCNSSMNNSKSAATSGPFANALAYKVYADLPICQSSNLVKIAYVINEQKYFYCMNGVWSDQL